MKAKTKTCPEIPEQTIRHPLENIEIYSGQSMSSFSKLHNDFAGWDEIVAFALTNSQTLYVFRHNRLVKTINHPQVKKENA